MLGLNLGSGRTRPAKEGQQWINMDNDPNAQPDVLRDVLQGIPFSDNTFDIVLCSHFLEHFGGKDFVFVMNEIHRVLKPSGELHILGPYYKHYGAWTDPHHKMFFNEHTFEHWWFPTSSSQSMGVRGWFAPGVQEVADEQELRLVMRKVPFSALDAYVKMNAVVDAQGHKTAPDFLARITGKYYIEVKT